MPRNPRKVTFSICGVTRSKTDDGWLGDLADKRVLGGSDVPYLSLRDEERSLQPPENCRKLGQGLKYLGSLVCGIKGRQCSVIECLVSRHQARLLGSASKDSKILYLAS